MIYIRPGAHVLELLELLSVAGEFPMSALSILGNQRTMRELVCKLEDKQEIEASWSGKRYCARLLSISGKRGLMRNIRLHKSALPLLDELHPAAVDYYLSAFRNHAFSGKRGDIERNHRVAETLAMMFSSGIEIRPYLLPRLQTEHIEPTVGDMPCFYPSRIVKKLDGDSMNKTGFTRMTGLLLKKGVGFAVYNTRNAVMKWHGDGELKAMQQCEDLARRKAGILLACLLGSVLLLYLGGLLGQLLYNYEEWMRQDGMTGGVLMAELKASPLYCIPYAFTASGLKGTLFLLLGTGGVVLYVKLHDKFGSKEYDARNFTRSKSGAYGTAGWMEPKDVKKVFEVAPPDKAQGTILGELNGQAVCLPVDTKLNRHLLIFGASGTMKSRAVIRPYLIQSVKRQESVIVTDSKSELYNDMAGYFIDNGYEVKVFNLVDPRHSDSWNCMADLQQDTLLAQVLSDVIISNTSGERGDHFWDNGESNLLKALVLYVDHTTAFGAERRNLPEVYRFLTQTNEKQLSALFDKLPIEHPARAPYNLFRQSSDTVRSGILLGLGTRLQTLQSEQVKRILSRSDIDLTAPAKRKCAYFVILDDQNSTMNFLSSLFFSFLFIRLTRLADSSPGGRCPVPVNFVLDEFANIGTIGGNNGRDFARSAATLRSRSVALVLALQSLPQLQNRYGNNLWAEILGCCDTQLMLGCSDDVTATYVSTRSGDMTIDVNSTMTTRQTFAVAQVIPQYRYSEGLGKRRLLTPDEVLRLPHDEMLVALRGQKMLRLKKLDYTRLSAAKRLRPCSILDYQASDYSEPMSQPYAVQPQYTPLTPSVGDLYETATPPENF